MRVLVCGDRHWPKHGAFAIGNRIAFLPKDAVIVHGACRGADTIAANEAATLGYRIEPHPADWTQYGRAAGPIRNQEMLDSGIDLVLAFHPDLDLSKGTKDMVSRATKAGIEVEIINE